MAIGRIKINPASEAEYPKMCVMYIGEKVIVNCEQKKNPVTASHTAQIWGERKIAQIGV